MSVSRRLVAAAVEHVNAIAFALGFAALYAGLAGQFSHAVANIVAGLVVMTLAAWPFLAVRKR